MQVLDLYFFNESNKQECVTGKQRFIVGANQGFEWTHTRICLEVIVDCEYALMRLYSTCKHVTILMLIAFPYPRLPADGVLLEQDGQTNPVLMQLACIRKRCTSFPIYWHYFHDSYLTPQPSILCQLHISNMYGQG